MNSRRAYIVRRLFNKFKKPTPDGIIGFLLLGYKESVGGDWDRIGRLQFDFMKEIGLKPNHVLLDIGCGSLRAGIHFIRYLSDGNYLGIDKNKLLINSGIRKELGSDLYQKKRPKILVSNNFAFHHFSKIPDFALANSLFTHLSLADIELCMKQLRHLVHKGCRFYASFRITDIPIKKEQKSHSHRKFYYTVNQMKNIGKLHSWEPFYIGHWNHPEGIRIIEYTAV